MKVNKYMKKKYKYKNVKNPITYGTFDIFHFGHKRLIKRIYKQTGQKVITGVSSDNWNFKKGKIASETELQRSEKVKNYKYVKEVFFEDHNYDAEYWDRDVLKYNSSGIFLGSDVEGRIPIEKIKSPLYFLQRTPFISSTFLRNFKKK